MKKILILVPSRSSDGKRINSLNRLYNSWISTTDGNSDFLLGIDENDKHHYPNYENIILDINKQQLNVIEKINYLSSKYIKNYDYVYFVGDDCYFKTSGWENKFLEESRDKKYVMFYPNDFLQGHRLSTHIFMSTRIIKKLGFMGPPCLKHMFVDNFWMNLGNALGCLKYFPDVILEHMHYSVGKNEIDDLYKKNDSYYNEDQNNFHLYMKNNFYNDVKKVKDED